MVIEGSAYPARLAIDYPEQLSRVTTAFRIILLIPIALILGSIGASLFAVTLLVILFRLRYPRWWFDFQLELARFTTRVIAYLLLLTDQYPSTEDEQSVHLEIDYPDAARDLNRWLPLVKWLLAIPHYIVLLFLFIVALLAIVIAWFVILFTGRFPHGLFDFVVGVMRWGLRVQAYAFLLVTDRYPPFSVD